MDPEDAAVQAMIPFNVALLTIAAIFYCWRDLYVPRRASKQVARERIVRLLWAVAQTDSRPLKLRGPEPVECLEPDEFEEAEPALLLFRDVECRTCGGKHSFHLAPDTKRHPEATYEFTCSTTGKSAWIWWLGEPEPADEVPEGSLNLTRVRN